MLKARALRPRFTPPLRPPRLSPRSFYSTTSTPSSKPSNNVNTEPAAGPSQPAVQPEAETPRDQRVEELKQLLKDWVERTSTLIRNRADGYTVHAAATFAQLGKELNKVTGYGEIELLKRQVVDQEQRINTAREAARRAKEEYEQAVLQRANSQREVNDLLQRKSAWTDADVSRFTSLVRQDHLFEQSESRAKAAATLTESEVEREFSELMRVILYRYHEEQVWSDKIRSASTYGQLTVLGLNLLVFVMAILFVEPWKRRKLAQTFEMKVEEMTANMEATFEERTKVVSSRLNEQKELLVGMTETLAHYTSPDARLPSSVAPIPTDDDSPSDSGSISLAQTWLSAWYGDDLRWLVMGTTLSAATAAGWFARGWFGSS